MDKGEVASVTACGSLVRAVRAVHFAIADLVGGEAHRSVVGTRVLGRLADGGFTGLFIGAVLAVNVAVAHPALGDALACRKQRESSQGGIKRSFTFKKEERKGFPVSWLCNVAFNGMALNVNIFNVEMKASQPEQTVKL